LKHVSTVRDKSSPVVDRNLRIKQWPFKSTLRDLTQRKPNLKHVQTRDLSQPRIDRERVHIKRIGKMPWLNDVERGQFRLRHVTNINDRSSPNLKYAWEARLEKLGMAPRHDVFQQGGVSGRPAAAGVGGYDQQQRFARPYQQQQGGQYGQQFQQQQGYQQGQQQYGQQFQPQQQSVGAGGTRSGQWRQY
jgi:hypothetical protein